MIYFLAFDMKVAVGIKYTSTRRFAARFLMPEFGATGSSVPMP